MYIHSSNGLANKCHLLAISFNQSIEFQRFINFSVKKKLNCVD